MRVAVIRALGHHLPAGRLTNEELAALYPGWSAEKIREKTGVRERAVVAPGECASDLAVAAAERLFAKTGFERERIDLLLFCSQSPDYILPTTACLLQDRLQLRTDVAAFDYNLGCSAFPYGLAMVKGLIESGVRTNALLLMADTYTRHIHPLDKSVRTLFGDAASAILITAADAEAPVLGPFVFGTDGRGADKLIVRRGGMREPNDGPLVEIADDSGNVRTGANLYMDGPAILEFTMRHVPSLVRTVLERAGLTMDDIDHVVFHQASEYLLRYLQRKLAIPDEKFTVRLEACGNTVQSTIPIALEGLIAERRLQPGQRVLVAGFGVGYSWAANVIRWVPGL